MGWTLAQTSCTTSGFEQRGTAQSPADPVGGLVHGHPQAGAGQSDRGDRPVRPAAHDRRVHGAHRTAPAPGRAAGTGSGTGPEPGTAPWAPSGTGFGAGRPARGPSANWVAASRR